MAEQWWRLGAAQLAARIRAREVSARAVVEAHLGRIEALNPSLNAVTQTLAEQALAQAAALDAALARGEPAGPLAGVPFTIKGSIDVAGSPGTAGSIPARDAPAVERLRAAGAIPVARTNLPDFGLRMHTEHSRHGATRNPWDAARTPGGSSGGEAVAIATGMSPLGLGNDLGGSLRVPAQWCGVAALRPSVGRVPHAAEEGLPTLARRLFGAQGPLARRVADLRLALELIAGPHPRDPDALPVPLRPPGEEAPCRVAVTVDPAGRGVDAEVARGIEAAAEALRDAGYVVEPAEPPAIEAAAALWARLVYAEVRASLPLLRTLAPPPALRYTELTLALEPAASLDGYMQGFAERQGLLAEWSQFLERYPLILGPVSTMLPFPLGYDVAGPEQAASVRASLRLTLCANLLGLPAVAVPAGVAVVDGRPLPLGAQLIGGRFEEPRCLAAAEAIEQRLGAPTPVAPAPSPRGGAPAAGP